MNELFRVRKDTSSPPLNPSPYSKLHTVRNEKRFCLLTLRVKNIRTLRLFYFLMVLYPKAGFMKY